MRLILTALLCLALFCCSEKKQEQAKSPQTPFVIRGNEALLPAMGKLAKKSGADSLYDFKVAGGGSLPGLDSVRTGEADLVVATFPLDTAASQRFIAAGKEAVGVKVAEDALALIVHNHNPVSKLTAEQVAGIFTGSIINWKQVGGEDLRIVLYSRDSKSGTYEFFSREMLAGAPVDDEARILPANSLMLQKVAQNKGAIGYISTARAEAGVKVLPLVSKGSEASNLSRPVYVYYTREKEAKVKPFVDFMLSPGGQKIIADEGYTSIINQ